MTALQSSVFGIFFSRICSLKNIRSADNSSLTQTSFVSILIRKKIIINFIMNQENLQTRE